MNSKPFIHPNTPPRLVRKFKECEYKFLKLAQERKVNMKYIHDLITHGIEPTDRTEKGRDARAAMFLPRHKRKKWKECNQCGKPVELTQSGNLQSHSRPDGLYCKGSFTADFLPQFRPKQTPIQQRIRRMAKETRQAIFRKE